MQVTIVDLNHEEREKLVNFLKDKEVVFKRRLQVMDKESKMLAEVQAKPPASVTEAWLKDLAARIKEYSNILDGNKASIHQYNEIITGIVNGTEAPIGDLIVNALYELYNLERGKKQVEQKYQYYPRLKKAKEAALYVFSNKVKIIMESEYVKVA